MAQEASRLKQRVHRIKVCGVCSYNLSLIVDRLSLMINGPNRAQQEEDLCFMVTEQAARFVQKQRDTGKKSLLGLDLRPAASSPCVR